MQAVDHLAHLENMYHHNQGRAIHILSNLMAEENSSRSGSSEEDVKAKATTDTTSAFMDARRELFGWLDDCLRV